MSHANTLNHIQETLFDPGAEVLRQFGSQVTRFTQEGFIDSIRDLPLLSVKPQGQLSLLEIPNVERRFTNGSVN